MDGFGHHLLAHSGFAEDEDVDRPGGRPLGHPVDLLHRLFPPHRHGRDEVRLRERGRVGGARPRAPRCDRTWTMRTEDPMAMVSPDWMGTFSPRRDGPVADPGAVDAAQVFHEQHVADGQAGVRPGRLQVVDAHIGGVGAAYGDGAGSRQVVRLVRPVPDDQQPHPGSVAAPIRRLAWNRRAVLQSVPERTHRAGRDARPSPAGLASWFSHNLSRLCTVCAT